MATKTNHAFFNIGHGTRQRFFFIILRKKIFMLLTFF